MVTTKLAGSAGVAKQVILLVDDHPIFRQGLEAFLKKHQPELTCVHADSPLAALATIRNFPPDVAIVDISLAGGTDGIPLITRLKAEQPHLNIMVLSMHDEPASVLRAFKAGAQAYVMKTDPPREVIEAINNIAGGEIFLGSRLRQNSAFKVLYGAESVMRELTDREAEVLSLAGNGYSTASIAKELGLSIKTVETHQAHIKEKLGLSTGKEMIDFAINLVNYREPTKDITTS